MQREMSSCSGHHRAEQASADVLELARVITSVYRALHDSAQGVECLGLESRRRHPIEGHHEETGEGKGCASSSALCVGP